MTFEKAQPAQKHFRAAGFCGCGIRDNFLSTRYNSETLESNHANCELAKDNLRRVAGGGFNNDRGWSENFSRRQLRASSRSNHAAHHPRRRRAALE